MIRGIRGATTIRINSEEEIIRQTKRLLEEIITANQVTPTSVASVFISVTDDVTAAFPAKALRLLPGWTYVPVMCMREMVAENGLKSCIRVMMHVNTDTAQENIQHVYLEEATILRPDLTNKPSEKGDEK